MAQIAVKTKNEYREQVAARVSNHTFNNRSGKRISGLKNYSGGMDGFVAVDSTLNGTGKLSLSKLRTLIGGGSGGVTLEEVQDMVNAETKRASDAEEALAEQIAGISSGGDCNVVVMNLASALESIYGEMQVADVPVDSQAPTQVVNSQASTQVWDDMIDVLLDGKILAVTMPIEEGMAAIAICQNSFAVPSGYSKDDFKEMLRGIPLMSTLSFLFEASLYGGLAKIGVKIMVTPSEGVVPYYLYMEAAGKIILEEQTIYDDGPNFGKKTILGEALIGFEMDGDTGTFSATQRSLPLILQDLAQNGKRITLSGANYDNSFMFGMVPVTVGTAEEAGQDLSLECQAIATNNVQGEHYDETYPIVYRGTFVYDADLSAGQFSGLYRLSHDETYILTTEPPILGGNNAEWQ